MNYSQNEINFLCRLLGYGKLVGFDEFGMLSQEESEEVIQSLEEKKIIEDGQFTEKGLALEQFLQFYINSTKYIHLGHCLLGNYQDNQYIMIKEKDNEIEVLPVTQDEVVFSILAQFVDELESIEEGRLRNRMMSKRRFQKYMEEHKDAKAIYYTYVDMETHQQKVAVIYYADHKLQHYNVLKEELTSYSKEYVQQGIESIFRWEADEICQKLN